MILHWSYDLWKTEQRPYLWVEIDLGNDTNVCLNSCFVPSILGDATLGTLVKGNHAPIPKGLSADVRCKNVHIFFEVPKYIRRAH